MTGTIDDSNSLVGSNPGDQVGSGGVAALANGNYVVQSPLWNNARGAVTWGNGTGGVTGVVSDSNSLVGTDPSDQVGSGGPFPGVVGLANGNYVAVSPNWRGQRGAVTWADGTKGITGFVANTNSLVGDNTGDQVGVFGVTALSNGNYVTDSPYWNSDGAVTWANGTIGITGSITAANSLVGTSGNPIGDHVTALGNGNYVVGSPRWMTGTGAATWGSGTAGVTGTISDANSPIGSAWFDNVGSKVVALSNSNYVVYSPGFKSNAGAVTWASGTTGLTGVLSTGNSLVGSNSNDEVGGGGIFPLTNGNYVAASPQWNNLRGAATWGNGTSGTTGVVDASNSIVGSLSATDQVSSGGITVLSNGNYLVESPHWNNDRGAATWGSGSTGVTGVVGAGNSLVGSNANDQVGSGGIAVLSNGNYVVSSPNWGGANPLSFNGPSGAVTWGNGALGVDGIISADNSLITSASSIVPLSNGNYVVDSPMWNGGFGAVTWGNGTAPLTGPVAATNSLVGGNYYDNVGGGGVTALANGNYVVNSPNWQLSGAVTWANGTVGITGTISQSNSLIGSSGDLLGSGGITALSNGNYVISSPTWNGFSGAATWANGTIGITGTISQSNSLVGKYGDGISSGGVFALANGNYVVSSPNWKQGLGAVTWGNGSAGLTGTVDASNSLIG